MPQPDISANDADFEAHPYSFCARLRAAGGIEGSLIRGVTRLPVRW